MISLIPPPIKTAISEFRSGIVTIVWHQFFLGMYRLFSQPSYGAKICTFQITGITGDYTTDYKWISDRDFVHFVVTITPSAGTKIGIKDASILPVLSNTAIDNKPTKITNVEVTLLDGSTIKDFRLTSIDTNGLILIPNSILTRYTLKISGNFMITF